MVYGTGMAQENSVLPLWTNRYPMITKVKQRLGPVSTWMGDRPNEVCQVLLEGVPAS
jgi:hypothetical protein